MIKKLFGPDVLMDVWKKVLAWIVIGLITLLIAFFASDRFADFVKWALLNPVSLEVTSGALILIALIVALLVVTVWYLWRSNSVEPYGASVVEVMAAVEQVGEPEADYAPSERAVRIMAALSEVDWPDNEASANQLADHIGANINTVQLGLTELFDNEFLLDSWHSGDRWFRLAPDGQAYAIEHGMIDDL